MERLEPVYRPAGNRCPRCGGQSLLDPDTQYDPKPARACLQCGRREYVYVGDRHLTPPSWSGKGSVYLPVPGKRMGGGRE